jgi:sortase A
MKHFLHSARYFFFALAILALGYSAYAVLDARLFQAYQNRRFQRALSAKAPPPAGDQRLQPSLLPPDVAEASPARAANRVMGGSEGTPLGRIEISSVGLAAIILEGTESGTLRRAVGHVPGTALPGQPGNVALAGHRDTFFRGLRKIQNGDEITLTTLDGVTRYLVDSTQVVEPSSTTVLDSSEDAILTLVTCYPFSYVGSAPKRFIVRAHKVPLG